MTYRTPFSNSFVEVYILFITQKYVHRPPYMALHFCDNTRHHGNCSTISFCIVKIWLNRIRLWHYKFPYNNATKRNSGNGIINTDYRYAISFRNIKKNENKNASHNIWLYQQYTQVSISCLCSAYFNMFRNLVKSLMQEENSTYKKEP